MPLPERFDELVKAFDDPDYPGWSVGSAEAGWVTPSEAEWGNSKPAEAPQATEASQTATK